MDMDPQIPLPKLEKLMLRRTRIWIDMEVTSEGTADDPQNLYLLVLIHNGQNQN